MYSNILNSLGIEIDLIYLLGGLGAFSLILLVMVIVSLVKIRKLNKRYLTFMEGKDGKSLEDRIHEKFKEIDGLKEANKTNEEQISKMKEVEIESLKKNLLSAYQRIGIVKYDAFHEMGGKLSFVLALLNDEKDGFLLNVMHSREGCYAYMKEVIKGESFIILADEEKEALQKAMEEDR